MIYYVSNSGLDSNNGKTPETAWKTIEKVNATIKSGDTVKFRCQDTFYGRIAPPSGADAEHRTTLTYYGEGERPIISQYKTAVKSAWEKISDNVYKIDMSNTDNYTGNTANIDSNAGFLKISGQIFYKKKTAIEQLNSQWDYWCDNKNKAIYVFSEKYPYELSDSIMIACNIKSIAFASHLAVIGLEICGTGGHGIAGVTEGALIKDCYFHEIGGSELIGYPRPNVRYGNCIETWSNSREVTVDSCLFADVYDVAITMQGSNVMKPWENMCFTNNKFWNCTQCFEIWSTGNDTKIGFVNCHFKNNVCLNSGKSWGYAARPDKSCSTPLLIYGVHSEICDITVSENIFEGSGIATLFKQGGARAIPTDYKIKNNIIIKPAKQPILYKPENEDDEAYNAFEKLIRDTNLVIDRYE